MSLRFYLYNNNNNNNNNAFYQIKDCGKIKYIGQIIESGDSNSHFLV